jgi:LysR family transcriptional regulator, hydrogen peroxide-inducible genes activator
MELHQLRYFCAVADTASFSRAAEKCHVSQPSLSQQILKLESELGGRLFDRLGRSVRLTDLGDAFLPRARSVLHELSSAKDELTERLQSEAGPVVIGAIPTVAPYWLASRLATFSRKFPKVHLTIAEEITPTLLDRLRSGSVDLAVLALPIRGHEFDAHPLFSERLFAALPKNHKLARRPTLQLADLRRDPFLFLRDGHCFRDTAVAACDRARLNPHVVFESGHLSSLLAMVGAGMGVSLVPEMAVDKSRLCRFVRIADPQAERTIAAVVLRGRTLNRGSRALLSHLR